MSKQLLLAISLTVVIVTAFVTLLVNTGNPNIASKNEVGTAVNQAKYIYGQKKLLGGDISRGPCLSNALIPGWVLDIAHNPRQAIDDLPENQCPAYLEGSAIHFVELDLEGDLIRYK